jgi:hypothetical protein
VLSPGQIYQLQILQDIYDISTACSTKTYVWGGFVMDIMEGRFLREHHDIDCFTLNLLDVKEKVDNLFVSKGYHTQYIHDIDMYQIKINGCGTAFNRLEVEKETAMWRHIGNEGTLFFPVRWLKDTPVLFYGVPIFISGPEFEYAIKARVELLSPEWQLRGIDESSREYYLKALEQRGISPEEVLEQVRSDNPYWIK